MTNNTSDNEDMRDTLHPIFTVGEIKAVMEISREYYEEYREYWDDTKDFVGKVLNKLKTDKKYKLNEEETEVLLKRFELSCNYNHKEKEVSFMIEANINFLNGKTKGTLYDTVCKTIYPDFTTKEEVEKSVKDWLKPYTLRQK